MTPQQAQAVRQIVGALLETVTAMGTRGAPGGRLYAAAMGHMSLEQFEVLMGALVTAGKVRRQGHVYYAV